MTRKAEQKARDTGKLHPLVDPKGFGVIRRSLPRFEKRDNLFELTVGTPIPISTRLDTTGSMGGNVDLALKALERFYELLSQVLPGYDIQVMNEIFGDMTDLFVLCRSQFEMEAGKIVEQLTLMVPERDGGDWTEDPHYGIFGAAYLTWDHLSRKLSLKGYDFTVTDAPSRKRFDIRQLQETFGEDVFEKVSENEFQLDYNDTTLNEAVQDLLKRAHAFVIQVKNDGESETNKFWSEIYGNDRVVIIPDTKILPEVQAVIIGLTEGTLSLDKVKGFLIRNNVTEEMAEKIARSVSKIPIGAQTTLPNFGKIPQKGALFRNKTDTWPIEGHFVEETTEEDGPNWL